MIEGLKVDVTGQEVATLMRARAAHHYERARFYEEQAKALEDGDAKDAGFTGGDPIRALRQNGAQHTSEAACMEFEAAHVSPGETYRLDRDDLRRLGIAPDQRW